MNIYIYMNTYYDLYVYMNTYYITRLEEATFRPSEPQA